MNKQPLTIHGIPALLWGPPAGRLYIAVHGDGSHKEDDVIAILAEEAAEKGHRVLSFDLPRHGSRREDPRPDTPQNCAEDIAAIEGYARGLSQDIALFGCSIGAYFSMLALRGRPLRQALFLSPIVDMERLIENMMGWFGVSEARLEREGEIATPLKTLSWDYLRYVRAHPVEWGTPTAILCGSKDTLSPPDVVQGFARRWGAEVEVLEEGEHYFHTPAQLAHFRSWLRRHMAP